MNLEWPWVGGKCGLPTVRRHHKWPPGDLKGVFFHFSGSLSILMVAMCVFLFVWFLPLSFDACLVRRIYKVLHMLKAL
jgi:hypothetical protein